MNSVDLPNYLKIKNDLPKGVNLLAVSKGFGSKSIESLHSLGQQHFGESKVQEALQKDYLLNNKLNIKLHFIGRIQSNKIRKIVENFDFIHSVDSYSKLLKIAKISDEIGKSPITMIQVKLEDEPQKGGMFTDELIGKWDSIKMIKGLNIKGLMTINPKGLSSQENLNLFRKCKSLAESLELPECSMGMSIDWKEAVDAGSTWVRIGSSIFGKRDV